MFYVGAVWCGELVVKKAKFLAGFVPPGDKISQKRIMYIMYSFVYWCSPKVYIKGLYIGLYIMCVVVGNRAALMGLYKAYKGLYVINIRSFVTLFVYWVCKIINENHVS